MRISKEWLKDCLDYQTDDEQLTDILTTIGLEVEGVEQVESLPGGLQGLIVGKVLTCEKHPDADRLSLTTVDIGANNPLQIVCGASNVSAGQLVAVATVGTTLYPIDGEPFKIKKGKIRGEVSEGMICAEDEIGMGKNHDGIMILDQDKAKIGMPLADYFEVTSDLAIDIGLTPNRSDATAHMGVAEDIKAYLTFHKIGHPSLKKPSVEDFDIKHVSKRITIQVKDTAACPRYAGVVLDNVKVKPSPQWMQNRLKTIGVRPINNIVDITNYVLHELGQPLHAFDYDKIANCEVVVTKLPQGTTFTSLDERKRELHAEDLMICDGNLQPMCIGGVFGGLGSGVTEDTTTIFLESAHFESGHIRRSSTRHDLRTDAAKIFEKGSDPNICAYALKRAALLIVQYGEATIASEVYDIYPKPKQPAQIVLSYDRVRTVIGASLTNENIQDILRALNMEILPVSDAQAKVMVPTNKADVIREIDLIEEILRIYGFNNVDVPKKLQSTLSYRPKPDKKTVLRKASEFLAAKGFHEMMGLSLIPSAHYNSYSSYTEGIVHINNTSNVHLDAMRPEMMMSGLLSVAHNVNRQQRLIRLFEIGNAYLKNSDDFEEKQYLTILLSGPAAALGWRTDYKRSVDFSDLKTIVWALLEKLGLHQNKVSETSDDRLAYGLDIHRGPNVWVKLGRVNDSWAQTAGVKQEVFYAEIDVEWMLTFLKSKKDTTQPISKYPIVSRDLAIVLDETVTFDQLSQLAHKQAKSLLKEVTLFDIYRNKQQLGANKKSYALNFVFEHMDHTLTDQEIDKAMKSITTAFESSLGASIRS